ncbi:hypothetical protein, partial [Staphylococcus aureus]|uniref:hypothetical protein n=1 Tax=Staphylococcus aureus TaxID=1280 RepID=UPI0038B25AF7
MTECVQKDSSQEILESVQSDTDIKVEHDTSQPANDDCMYWQSECFDQSSSSVVPDHSLPSTSNVSHQPPSSVSQVPLPHQLSASSV